MPFPTVITIEFPALDALIAYLRDHDVAQATIDGLTADVEGLVQRLHDANTKLGNVTADEQSERP